jgi:anaerobic magnesium-protoporphyrin IX monomethyl ester cyclase
MDVKRVGFISPMWLDIENPYPPLGIAYISAVLEQEGYVVRIFDFSLHPEKSVDEKINEVIEFKPDVIGITCMTNTYANALEIARRVKKSRDIPIIFGGPHATVLPEETLDNGEVDYVVTGEGEHTTLKLIKSSREGLEDIPGIGYREDGNIHVNPPGPYIQNLDGLPYPARHLLDLEAYTLSAPDGGKMASVMSSRGCPYGCTYCFKDLFGRRYRARSPEDIVEEILELKNKFGYNYIYFIDDLFTYDAGRVGKICSLIKEKNLEISWQCLARVDRVDYNLLKTMKEAGCFKIHFGIESGNPKILKRIRKAINLDQVREAVENCRKVGIKTKGYFMLGLPGDTEETMRETIKFAYDLRLDEWMFSVTTPFPGTEMWAGLPEGERMHLSELFNKAYYYTYTSRDVSIMHNMSEESDGKVLEMLVLAEEMKLRKRLERRYGMLICYMAFRFIRTYPINVLAKQFFVARNKLQGKLKEIAF